jgi:iron-sulfur cluster assembly accessory protein
MDDAQIFSLTDKAVAMVRAARERESLGPNHVLRVGVVGGGCSGFSYTMAFDDQAKEDDTVIEVDDVKVVVDAASREFLNGTVLDYVTGLHGGGFKFENPKAARLCGCGTSFSV